jgi:hypothetical protein
LKVFCHFWTSLIHWQCVKWTAELASGSRVFFLFQDDWNLANSESHEPTNLGKFKKSQFRSLDKWWSSRIRFRKSVECQVKDVISKSPGLKCELVSGL